MSSGRGSAELHVETGSSSGDQRLADTRQPGRGCRFQRTDRNSLRQRSNREPRPLDVSGNVRHSSEAIETSWFRKAQILRPERRITDQPGLAIIRLVTVRVGDLSGQGLSSQERLDWLPIVDDRCFDPHCISGICTLRNAGKVVNQSFLRTRAAAARAVVPAFRAPVRYPESSAVHRSPG
jgi:hypothetical protein